MSELFTAGIGAVVSADIAVPEHDREMRFYSRVLSTGANPLWSEENLLNNLGIPIIGLGKQSPAYSHLPLQWMPHIQVADVGACARYAPEAGGKVLMHSQDAAGNSQWAVLQDPNGAAFGVIPIVSRDGGSDTEASSSVPETAMGRIAWLDLTVSDASATRDFYRNVVGWSVQDVEMKDEGEGYADYNMIGGGGTPAAGVCHARGSNVGLPAVWMIYLPVGDLGESLRRVEAGGGKVLKSMRGQDGTYAYAAIQDPLGVSLALIPG